MKTNNLQNQINKVINLNSLILKSFAFVMLLTVSLSTITPAFATVPQSMSYSAVLRDTTGTPLSGSYDFKVRYYDASAGGILMYEEEFTTTNINTGGTFFLPLGTGSIITGTFSTINFNSPIFITLNTKLNTAGTYDGEMNPRIPLRSVPYALNSQKLDGRVVGGASGIVAYDASSTINTNGLNASGTVNILNNLNVNATSTLGSVVSNLVSSLVGIFSKLFLDPVAPGLATDTILVRDNVTGEVKGITAAGILASSTTNTLSTTTNSFSTIINGIQSSFANIVNSFTQSVTGNTLTSVVNGVTATTTLISNNSITFATGTGVITTDINGVISTTSLASLALASTTNTLGFSTSTNLLSSIVNGVLSTTSIFALTEADNGLSLTGSSTVGLGGVLNKNTTIDGNGGTYDISFQDFRNFEIIGGGLGSFGTIANSNLSLIGTEKLSIVTPNINSNLGATGTVLVSRDNQGSVEFETVASLLSSNTTNSLNFSTSTNLLSSIVNGILSTTSIAISSNNFANANLTATGDRQHNFSNFDLKINSINAFDISASSSNQNYANNYNLSSQSLTFSSFGIIDFLSSDSTYFSSTNRNIFTAGINNVFTGVTNTQLGPSSGYGALFRNNGTQKQQFLELQQTGVANSFGILAGNSDPEGLYAAQLGSIYLNKSGLTGKAYLKTSNNAGNTGWSEILTGSGFSTTTTSNLQQVTDNGATTTNDITVSNLAGQYTRQGRASFTVGTTYNNNSTRLSFVAPFGTNNNVYLPGIIDGVLALSVNNIQADSNGDIDITPLLTNVGNFATADLTATGNRFHNFNNFGLSINNVTDFELNSQNTGRLSAGGFGSAAQIEYNGSANINMLIGDITQGASSNLSLAKNGIALRSANNLFGYDNELTILNGELNYKNNLTGFNILKANQNGNISFGSYQNSRNDNTGLASSTPINFLYTNPAGELLSAPLSSIISSTSTNFANADLTANGNRIHDFAGFNLGINSINAFNINATGSSQAYNSLYEVNSEDTRFVSTNSVGLFSGGSMVMSAGNIELNSTAGSTYFNTAGQNVFTANNGNNIFVGTTFPSVAVPGFGYSTLITSKGTQKQQFLELYQDATNNSFGVMGGNINPQNNYVARLGSIYFNRDGTSGKAYLKTSNDLLNTGWDRILTLADLASTTSASTTNLLSFSTSTNILSSVVNGIRSTTSLPSAASPITIQNTSSLFATGLPNPAGVGATNADNSNFFGDSAGQNSTNADNSNFFGRFAGNSAINANNSNFLGFVAGARATNAANSNFIGRSAGSDAINSSSSNFIGNGAGSQATNAANANFIGNNAGAFAVNARDSIFIGSNAGTLDTVNNTLGGTSILIGSNTGTGGFSNSIALGANAFNTKTNQFLVGPAYSDFNFRGVNYVFPSTQATGTGKVLTNDGLGNLSWQSAGTTTPTTNLLNFSTSTNILSTNVNGILATTSISNIISPITVRNGNSLFSTGLLNTGGGSVAVNSNFFGELAGQGAVNANSSNFFGNVAGESAVNAFNSNFFGGNAGVNAASANNSNFFGKDAGANARNSFNSNFLGQLSGDDATNANNSNFFGLAAGRSATNAKNSNFFGLSAGQNSANANNSIFIGNSSGANDTVNNSLNGTSILIGDNTSTGGFSNSIALGKSAVNTKVNQFLVGPAYSDFSFRGVNYTFPSTQGATGTTLTNDGAGVLSWVNSATVATPSPITIENNESLFSTGLSGAGSGATGANHSNFFGRDAGFNAVTAEGSNFLGVRSGFFATNAYRSNFIGSIAGRQATNANSSNFLGYGSGLSATNANNSNFFGENAGDSAVNANNSNFFGASAGQGATEALGSNFFGAFAGQGATNANSSNFFGSQAGNGAVNASSSNFFGEGSGLAATNAANSNFFGTRSGFQANNAANSIFIGENSGLNDIVDNIISEGTSILIGRNTNTGGFSNSIALGANAINTKTNQFLVGQNYTDFNFRGVNYVFPSSQATTSGQVLTNDGSGNLSWGSVSGGGPDTNFATTNLTATGNRVHNFAGNSLTLNNISTFQFASFGGHNFSAGGLVDYVAAGGFRFLSPLMRVESLTPNTSGLRLVNLTSSSPVSTSTTQTLGVDALGNVVNIATTNLLSFATTTSELTSVVNGITSTTSLLSVISAAWNINGNTGTNPLTDFVGTRDLTDLIFKTNNIESMRLSATGTLSILGNINTVSPGAPITIRPTARATAGTGAQALMQGGAAGLTGTGGLARLVGGTGGTTSGNGGNVNILGGQAVEGNGGSISFSPANGASLTGIARNGGNFTFQAGAPVFGGIAGRVGINGGPGNVSDGGRVEIFGGLATTGFTGGNTSLRSGGSIDGNAGNLVLGGAVGTGVAGNGGNVIIGGGSVTSGGIIGATIFASAIQSDTVFTERMRLASNGNFGIGTNAPTERLQVGDAGSLGNILVFGTGSTCSIGNGVGATLCSSDERLKYDILTSTSNLEKILSLRSVNYKWNTNLNRSSSTQLGLIAQEVEKVFPGYVSVVYDGMKGVDYAALVTPLIGSVQELNAKLTALETRTNASSTNSGVGSYTDMIASLTSKLQDGSLDIIVNNIKANKVETKELCLEDVCISKAQFIQMLQSSGVTQNGSSNNTNNNPTPILLICTLPQVINVSGTACETPLIIDPVTPTVDPAPSTDSNASSTMP